MPPPGAKKLFSRTPFAWDMSGSTPPLSLSYNPYNPIQQVDPGTAFNSPAMDYPFLYHAGSVYAAFCPDSGNPPQSDTEFSATTSTTVQTSQGESVVSNVVLYIPAPSPRTWGVPGFMPRVPRSVLITGVQDVSPQSTAAFIAAISPTLAQAGCALVLAASTNTYGGSPTIPNNFSVFSNNTSPMCNWAPQCIDRSLSTINANSVITNWPTPVQDTPIPNLDWLGGEVLYLPVSATPWFGHIYAFEDPAKFSSVPGLSNSGFTVYSAGPADITGAAMFIAEDTPMLFAAGKLLPSLLSRVSRFSAQFMYDPAGPPSNTAKLIAAYSPTALWGRCNDFTAGNLFQINFTKTAVSGLWDSLFGASATGLSDVFLSLIQGNVISAISSFWQN